MGKAKEVSVSRVCIYCSEILTHWHSGVFVCLNPECGAGKLRIEELMPKKEG